MSQIRTNYRGEIHITKIILNKAFHASVDLLGKINKAKCFVILIQEPYCYKGTLSGTPGKAYIIWHSAAHIL